MFEAHAPCYGSYPSVNRNTTIRPTREQDTATADRRDAGKAELQQLLAELSRQSNQAW